MKKALELYTHEELKDFVEAYNGDRYVLHNNFEVSGTPTYDGSGQYNIAKGSDFMYELMENFLMELDKRGYKIVPK